MNSRSATSRTPTCRVVRIEFKGRRRCGRIQSKQQAGEAHFDCHCEAAPHVVSPLPPKSISLTGVAAALLLKSNPSPLRRRVCRWGRPSRPAWLSEWPVGEPPDWTELVNRPATEAELAALRRSAWRGRPYGSETWARQTAARLGLLSTLRPRGRPRKGDDHGPAQQLMF